MNFFTRPDNADRLANLITLRDGIKALYGDATQAPTFDMRDFCRAPGKDAAYCDSHEAFCGTVCCALGHGPQLGIGYADTGKKFVPLDTTLDDYNQWADYSDQFFCDSALMEWAFLFGEDWPSDIQQFIKRADIVISGKWIPDDWPIDYSAKY